MLRKQKFSGSNITVDDPNIRILRKSKFPETYLTGRLSEYSDASKVEPNFRELTGCFFIAEGHYWKLWKCAYYETRRNHKCLWERIFKNVGNYWRNHETKRGWDRKETWITGWTWRRLGMSHRRGQNESFIMTHIHLTENWSLLTRKAHKTHNCQFPDIFRSSFPISDIFSTSDIFYRTFLECQLAKRSWMRN